MNYLDSVNKKKQEADARAQVDFLHKQDLANARNSANNIVDAIKTDSTKTKNVNVVNDLATKTDIIDVISQLKIGNEQRGVMIDSGVKTEVFVKPLDEKITAALEALKSNNANDKLAKQLDGSFKDFTKEISSFMVAHQDMMTAIPQEIQDAVSGIDVKPVINVPKSTVNVSPSNIDLSPLLDKLANVEKAISKIKLPQVDNTDLLITVDSVRSAIENQKFPVPNYILPYKDINGKAVQVQLTADGFIPIDISLSEGISTSTNQTSGAQKTQITDSSGTANTLKTLNTQVVATDVGIVTNSVIHGITTGGGGGYVDVKVNPSGALTVETTLTASALTIGNTGTPSATINIGQTTSAVTATQLTASSIAMTNGVVIQALSTNTASVYIGNSGVTLLNGFELTAGSSLTISPSNINLVYVIGSNATDKVCWSVT